LSRASAPATTTNRSRKTSSANSRDVQKIRAPALRLRLAAMGATPVANIEASRPATARRRLSPHISFGQIIRVSIIALIACLVVAFPPPGFDAGKIVTSDVDAHTER
jgi:hypothetical protein